MSPVSSSLRKWSLRSLVQPLPVGANRSVLVMPRRHHDLTESHAHSTQGSAMNNRLHIATLTTLTLGLCLSQGCDGGVQAVLHRELQASRDRPLNENTLWYHQVAPELTRALQSSDRMRGEPRDWIGVALGDCAWLSDSLEPLCADGPAGLCPVQIFQRAEDSWSLVASTTANAPDGTPAWFAHAACIEQLHDHGAWRPLIQHLGAIGAPLPLPDCGQLCPRDVPAFQSWQEQQRVLEVEQEEVVRELSEVGLSEEQLYHAAVFVGHRCLWLIDTTHEDCGGIVTSSCPATIFDRVEDALVLRGRVPFSTASDTDSLCRLPLPQPISVWPPSAPQVDRAHHIGHLLVSRTSTDDTRLPLSRGDCGQAGISGPLR